MIDSTKPTFIQEFTPSQQAPLFHQLKLSYFTGQIQIRDARGLEYTFYLYLGRIIYATGGRHKVRRWKRHINQCCRDLNVDNESLGVILSTVKPAEEFPLPWEYLLLDFWLKEGKITREQLLRFIRSLVSEVLLDLSQSGKINYFTVAYNTKSLNPAVVIDADQVIVGAWKMWQDWQSAKLGDRSPNMAPVLKKPEELKLQISPETYRIMVQHTTGDYSLRDLSVKLNRGLVSLTKAFMVYVQLGVIELQEIPDLPSPQLDSIEPPSNFAQTSQKFLIGCVDDSPMVTGILEKLLNQAGYEFVGVNDSLQAFALFIARKPDLIFLDLVMPGTNGYELSASLRKLSIFRRTPIIMLTQNANILDRVRGKMSGFNDFVSKPIDSQEVLGIVERYLVTAT